MLQKDEVLNLINGIINEQNKEKLQEYIDLVNSMDDATWEKFCQEHDFTSIDKLKSELEKKINRMEEKFIELNELISYGRSRTALHIHVIPSDVHSLLTKKGLLKAEGLLIDALEKIQDLMKEDESIANVYAVSNIIQSLVARMFIRLDFDVKVMSLEEAKDDHELGYFYETFKDSNLGKLGRAQISREKLLSQEWEELKEERKKELEEKSKRNIGQNK